MLTPTALMHCRCLDKFEGLSNRPVHVAYLPHLNNWWATGRFSKVAALDPRAPALITEFVAAPNQLLVRETCMQACSGLSTRERAGQQQQQPAKLGSCVEGSGGFRQ